MLSDVETLLYRNHKYGVRIRKRKCRHFYLYLVIDLIPEDQVTTYLLYTISVYVKRVLHRDRNYVKYNLYSPS